MVNPLLLIAVPLLWAFLYPLVGKTGRIAAGIMSLLVMAFLAASGVSSLVALIGGADPFMAQTAGFSAPLTINLLLDSRAAWLYAASSLVALGTLASQLFKREGYWAGRQVVLFFVLVLGAGGLILTRDLFNVFVFLEITGIAIYGLLSTSRDDRVFEGGFKYMIAGGLSSVFFLVGIGLLYRASGALNIDALADAARRGAFANVEGVLGLASLLTAILVEAKPILASGWALDAYESADPGIGALLSGVVGTAVLAVLAKILPLFTGVAAEFSTALAALGLLSFTLGNLQAIAQKSLKRMLGYSSSAQIGLVIALFGILARPLAPQSDFALLKLPLAFVLLLTHAFAKSGLFWIADRIGSDGTGSTVSPAVSLRAKPLLLILAGVSALALLGLPPFPSFAAKWALVVALGNGGRWLVLSLILIGSLLEGAYLLRWFAALCRKPGDPGTVAAEVIPADFAADESAADDPVSAPLADPAAPALRAASAAAAAGGLVSGTISALILALGGVALLLLRGLDPLMLAPVAAVAIFAFADLIRLPVKPQALFAIAFLALFGYAAWPSLSALQRIFAVIFVGGGAFQLVAFLNRNGRTPGLIAMVSAMIAALGTLLIARTPFEFFLAWELMTASSFFLVARGRRSGSASLTYIIFSLGSAFLILAGLALLPAEADLYALGAELFGSAATGNGILAAGILFALGILIKAGALGFHVWLPAAYAEAEDDVSSLLSSVLSKAAVFALFVAAGSFTLPLFGDSLGGALRSIDVAQLLGWLGAATAVAGAMMALFQEDIKYTLAYSSMGQLGYMILSFAAMTHLGWVSALYLAVTHLLFKSMIWLAVAGVILRVNTRLMYKMGGLIKRMPVSFVSVLIGIIALSGVPPLTGFGAKWLMYTALMEKGWYLQTALAMFSSGVAFLYLFRLIHSIFLGQLKEEHREVREAPLSVLIPQVVSMAAIFVLSMFPDLLIKPLQAAVEPSFASTVRWNGYEVISTLGYWNGNAVMYVVMGVFLAPLAWLVFVNGRTYWVKQFNIVFAAERPYKPDTTHYAFNFFGHYRKALGSLVEPQARRFWTATNRATVHLSDSLRRWNTGNPQAYALQLVLYLVVVISILKGGI